jgi:hypothetical protein
VQDAHVVGVDWWPTALGLAAAAVVVSAWFADRRMFVPAAAAIAIVSAVVHPGNNGIFDAVTLTAFALLALGRERLPRPWLWVVMVILLNALLTSWSFTETGYEPIPSVPLALGMVGLAWMIVDARPALAVAMTYAAGFGYGAVEAASGGDAVVLSANLPVIVLIAVLVIPAAWRLRRQVAL